MSGHYCPQQGQRFVIPWGGLRASRSCHWIGLETPLPERAQSLILEKGRRPAPLSALAGATLPLPLRNCLVWEGEGDVCTLSTSRRPLAKKNTKGFLIDMSFDLFALAVLQGFRQATTAQTGALLAFPLSSASLPYHASELLQVILHRHGSDSPPFSPSLSLPPLLCTVRIILGK